MVGLPGPTFVPLFFPVNESTEFCRRYPFLVAAATAFRISFVIVS
jgi:hypothetical protein